MKMAAITLLVIIFLGCGETVHEKPKVQAPGTSSGTDDNWHRLKHYIDKYVYKYPNWDNNDLTHRAFADSLDKGFARDVVDSGLLEYGPLKLYNIEKTGKNKNIVTFQLDNYLVDKKVHIMLNVVAVLNDSIAMGLNSHSYALKSFIVKKYEPARPPYIFSYAGPGTGMDVCDLGTLYIDCKKLE